jgi:hypothetical protein
MENQDNPGLLWGVRRIDSRTRDLLKKIPSLAAMLSRRRTASAAGERIHSDPPAPLSRLPNSCGPSDPLLLGHRDTALGCYRAFDLFYQRQKRDLERHFARECLEAERLQNRCTRQPRSRLSTRARPRDEGVIERIVEQRDSNRRASADPPVGKGVLARPVLPKENRALYCSSEPVFYWGA